MNTNYFSPETHDYSARLRELEQIIGPSVNKGDPNHCSLCKKRYEKSLKDNE